MNYEEIIADEQARTKAAKSLGITTTNPSWEEINAKAEHLKNMKGLDPAASVDDVIRAMDESALAKRAIEAGLPEGTDEATVRTYENQQRDERKNNPDMERLFRQMQEDQDALMERCGLSADNVDKDKIDKCNAIIAEKEGAPVESTPVISNDDTMAPVESSHQPTSFMPGVCQKGLTLVNTVDHRGVPVVACGEPRSLPPEDSDITCGVDGTSGVVVFHDGREKCPKGMTKLPNNTGPKRGNVR